MPDTAPIPEMSLGQRECLVSVIVPCRNEAGAIAGFLSSLWEQEIDGEWEAIIADGGSDDGTRECLEQFARTHRNIRIIENPKRHTAVGLNLAILAARGEFCVRMDVHTDYARDYVQRSIECLNEKQADNAGGPARTRARTRFQRAVAAAFHSVFSTGGAAFHRVDFEGYVDTVPYGCWRRERLIEFGLFDENLIRNEDDELNFRITLQGGRVYQSPRILSWYYPRDTLRGLIGQYFQYGFWKVYVIRKHHAVASWRHLVPTAFLLVNLLLLLLLGVGLWEISRHSRLGLLVVDGGYLSCNLLAAMQLAVRTGWLSLLYGPAIFLAFHLSYGAGFLMGCFYALWVPVQSVRGGVFQRLTR